MSSAVVDRDDRATVAVFGTILATLIAGLYYVGRIGFDNPRRPIVATLGLSLFVTVAPFLAWWLSPRGHYDEQEPWWRSQTFFTLVALGVSAAAGMAVPATGLNAIWILSAVGFAAAIFAIVIWLRRGSPLAILLFTAGTIVFALWAAGVAWSTRYKNPVFWETLEYKADVHHDPLYYVSMANNMRTYGVPSTGIDGVPYTPYHYGSAWMNSQWAYLTGRDVLEFYSLGPSVIVIPLFFSAVLLLAVEAKRGLTSPPVGERPLRTDYAAWLVFLAVTVGLIPTSGLDAMGIWNRHALISESYVLGMPVFLLVITTALVYWRRRKSSHRVGDFLFLLVFAPVMLVIAGLLKVSTMLLLLAAGLVIVLLGRLLRDRIIALSALLCVIASGITYKLVSVAAQNKGIVPFEFMRFEVNPAWWPYFILVHLFWSWIYIYLRLREEDVHTIGDVRQAALHGRITDVVAVTVVAIAGWAAGEVIAIHGGSAVYFSDVQRWLALSLLMASAWRWLARRRESQEFYRRVYIGVGGVRVAHLWLGIIGLAVGITMILNIVRAPATALRANIALRRALYAEAGVGGPVGIRSLSNPSTLDSGLRRSPDFALISTFRALDRTPDSLKQRTAVFIPQSYLHFWRIWTEPERCSFAPFIVPATSGMALIDGMPPVECDMTNQYGMTKYMRRTNPQLPVDTLPSTVCAKANAKGFSRVVIISGDSTRITQRVIDCSQPVAGSG